MSDSLEHIVIVILAAGSSSRMGEPKQLLPYNHTTLLGNAIEQAKKSDAQKIVLVLGANAHLIEEAHKSAEVEFVINPDWENGMGSSSPKADFKLFQLIEEARSRGGVPVFSLETLKPLLTIL